MIASCSSSSPLYSPAPSSVYYQSSDDPVYSESRLFTPLPISNITNRVLVLQHTSAATIKSRRALLRQAPTSAAKNMTMLPIDLKKSVRATRTRPLSFPHYLSPVAPVSNLSGQPFFLYSTDFATIKTRRACKKDARISAAAATYADTLTMIPVDLKASMRASARRVSFFGGLLAAFRKIVE